MPKARPDVARRAQRARRRDPLRRPENVDVPVPSAEEVVPVLTKLGMDASAPAIETCLLYTSPSPRDVEESRMPSSA